MLSQTEENYLKCIYKLVDGTTAPALTNHIAAAMRTTAGTVTDMVQRMSEKQLVHYEKYKGVTLTDAGLAAAMQLIRKHRLWEVFLHDKLGFAWDEVHDMAEELEHVTSSALVDRLALFLGNPQFDPHGDPIPDAEGRIAGRPQVALSTLASGDHGIITGVNEHSPAYLHYLQQAGLMLGVQIEVMEVVGFDQSMQVRTADLRVLQLSEKVCRHLFVQQTDVHHAN
jgi:DtxR family transcriptional regulator, Mn-dependent transcriptional regulator